MTPLAGPVRTLVIGGGITGLSAAHRHLELSMERATEPSVLLLEASSRLGGQIRTEHLEGHLLEAGPDTLVASKPAGIALCKRLGLEDQITGVDSTRHGIHILQRGRLVRLPDGLMMMAPADLGSVLRSPLFSLFGKIRMGLERYVRARPSATGDESLTSFVTRRFGREVAERVTEPVLASLYTADADRLGLAATLPRFLEMERRFGSITRAVADARRKRKQIAHGRHSVTYAHAAFLQGGLGRIVESLVERIGEERIRTESTIDDMAYDRSRGRWQVRLDDGTTVEAESVVLACPAFEAAKLVAKLDEDLAADLESLIYASCATVNMVYRRDDIRLPENSFGFFVPRAEPVPLLACSFVSEKFSGRAPDDRVLIRVFVGGARNPDQLDAPDDEIEQRTHDALSRFIDLRRPPVFSSTRRMMRSMPQYEVGYAKRIESIHRGASRMSGLSIAGTAVGAFGLPDCIASGEAAATEALERALDRPAATVSARS